MKEQLIEAMAHTRAEEKQHAIITGDCVLLKTHTKLRDQTMGQYPKDILPQAKLYI